MPRLEDYAHEVKLFKSTQCIFKHYNKCLKQLRFGAGRDLIKGFVIF